MKIYVAGKFQEVERVRELYRTLEGMGHEISYDWTEHVRAKPYEENKQLIQGYAQNELDAILDSDVMIYLSHERGTTLHMELGASIAKKALGQDIAIYLVGEHNNRSPWHFLPYVTRVDMVDEVLGKL